MQVMELGHVVLYVRNLERSAYFYRDVLGWRQIIPAMSDPESEPDGHRGLDASTPPAPGSRRSGPSAGTLGGAKVAAFSSPSNRTHHELLLIEVGEAAQAIPHGRRVGLYHFGLKIGNDDDALREALSKLRQAGVPITGASDHTVTHSLYVTDPDGNDIELYIDVAGMDWIKDPELIGAPIRPLSL